MFAVLLANKEMDFPLNLISEPIPGLNLFRLNMSGIDTQIHQRLSKNTIQIRDSRNHYLSAFPKNLADYLNFESDHYIS